MRRRHPTEDAASAAIRFAWWVSLLATLLLAFVVALASSASGAGPAPGPLGAAFPGEEEAWEEEPEGEEAWWCEVAPSGNEEADLEAELACEEELEGAEGPEAESGADGAPAECLLRSAGASVTAVPARRLVRVAVRHSGRGAAVGVGVRLRGARGSLSLGTERARFGRSGVYRQVERLSPAAMKRVLAARSFTVAVHALNTPRACHRHLDSELTVRRATGTSITWTEPPSRRGS